MAATFNEYGQAIVDAAGAARIYVKGPWRVGTVWQIGQVVLKATAAGGTTSCTADVYRAAEIPGLLLGSSVVADSDTLEGLFGDELAPGDQLLVIFAGCVPGSIATVNMRGKEIEQ